MPLALGTSLASIVFTSIFSAHAHHRRGAVNWSIVRRMTPGLALGAAVGGALTAYCSSHALKFFFLVFAIIAATQMLAGDPPQSARTLPGGGPLFAVSSAIAGVSSLVGIGGATLTVPLMTWYAVPLRHAIGSASALGLPIALAGTVAYVVIGLDKSGLPPLCVGFVHGPALIAISVGSALAVPAGAALSHRLPVAVLNRCFAALLYAVSWKMLSELL
jgi:uncharacterized membrane protein YfcA